MIKFPTLLILATTSIFAGSALAADECSQMRGSMHGPMHGDPGKFVAQMEKHHIRLHDKLKIAPEQEAAWKTFTEKVKPPTNAGEKMKAVCSELRALPTPARMDRMIALMKEREGRMVERAAAVKEFYAQLNPEQQKLFDDQRPMKRRR